VLTRKYRFPVDPIIKANGNCPSQDFYNGLDKPVKAKFNAIFIDINKSEKGFLKDSDRLRKLKGKHTGNLWEMRVRYKHEWYRMLCFRDGPAWKLTNGFTKKSNDTFMSEIKIGVAIKNEYLANKTQSV
jgi:hypothetical protein